MAVSGKYGMNFAPEVLWQTLLSSEAICYAIPELERLERIDPADHPDVPADRGEMMIWRGEGLFPGFGGKDEESATATITASNLDPCNGYTLQFESQIGHRRIQAVASIALTADAADKIQTTETESGSTSSSVTSTLIRWEAEIRDRDSGRPHVMFEWMAGLAAQHFFRRIDQYLKNGGIT